MHLKMITQHKYDSNYIILGNFDFLNYRNEDIVTPLNWQTVKECFTYLAACMMFKAQTPNFVSDHVTTASDIYDRDTRLSRATDVDIQPHNSALLKRNGM